MISQLLKVHYFLAKLKNAKLIFLFVLANLLLSFLFSLVLSFFDKKKLTTGFIPFNSVVEEILVAIFLAPLIETLIFQVAIIETIKKKLSPLLSCTVSALFFGLLHYYNFYYVLFAFLVGLMFAYLYYIGGSILRGSLLVLGTHALYNSIVFALSHIFKII
ncbi:MAG: CPBP family intramembrane glutamic endopeptidase [Ferruginibacter sp.]